MNPVIKVIKQKKREFENNRQSWSSPEEKNTNNRSRLIKIGLGVSLAALSVYAVSRFVKGKIANAEDIKSLGKDKHATWAKQIKNSFDNNGWWGTDEVLLRQVLREIPSKQDFQDVQKSYKKLFKGENLITTLTSELKQTEYNEMLAIINSKPTKAKDAGVQIYDPNGWAKRLNAAINYSALGLFWGTDEDAVTAVVIELPTQEAYFDTAEAYWTMYGVTLMEDMRGDFDESEIQKYRSIVLQKQKK